MIYLTGKQAFYVTCEEDSVGEWMMSKELFAELELKESSETLMGDALIEKDKIIPYHADDDLYNVATHTRAYLDMLFDERYDELKGVFMDSIQSKKCRAEIFKYAYHYGIGLERFQQIHIFMTSEFGNAWHSYCQNMLSLRKHIEASHKRKDGVVKKKSKHGPVNTTLSIVK